jgi:hypothetical protein
MKIKRPFGQAKIAKKNEDLKMIAMLSFSNLHFY